MPRTEPYCGPAPDASQWLWAWNTDPILLGALAGLTAMGWLWLEEARARRGLSLAACAAGLAFVSPLCAMTVALFSARTLHHLVVLGLLAPALAVALPLRRVPVVAAFLVLSVALWLWHVPRVYSAAWDSTAVYWLMQAALIVPGWAFWSGMLRGRALSNAIWLAPMVGQMGLLGALLTFAPAPFYAEHLAHAGRFGLSALQDQQLAGLIMWVPGMVPLAILTALTAWRALRAETQADATRADATRSDEATT